jgi:hypothetical protein
MACLGFLSSLVDGIDPLACARPGHEPSSLEIPAPRRGWVSHYEHEHMAWHPAHLFDPANWKAVLSKAVPKRDDWACPGFVER